MTDLEMARERARKALEENVWSKRPEAAPEQFWFCIFFSTDTGTAQDIARQIRGRAANVSLRRANI